MAAVTPLRSRKRGWRKHVLKRPRPPLYTRLLLNEDVLELQHSEDHSARMPRRLAVHGLRADHQGVYG